MSIHRKMAAVAVLLGCGAVAQADTVSYYLNQSNEETILPDGVNYLQVTISDGVSGNIDFKVDILQPLLNISGGNSFGLDSFGFSTSGAATAANVVGLPSLSWNVNTTTNQDGFGNFELVPQTNGANNRVTPTLNFSIAGVAGDAVYDYFVLSSGNAGQGNQFFAAHVAGFAVEGSSITSAYFGGSTPVPVPLPATLPLLLSGLGFCLSAARKKQRR